MQLTRRPHAPPVHTHCRAAPSTQLGRDSSLGRACFHPEKEPLGGAPGTLQTGRALTDGRRHKPPAEHGAEEEASMQERVKCPLF